MIEGVELSWKPKTELNSDAWFRSYAPLKSRFWTIFCGHCRAILTSLESGAIADVTSTKVYTLRSQCSLSDFAVNFSITLHAIPFHGKENTTAKERLREWIAFVKQKRAKWEASTASCLCSKHFKPEDYLRRFNWSEFLISLKLISVCSRSPWNAYMTQAKWNSGWPEIHFGFSGRFEFSGRPEIFMWAETFFVSGRIEISKQVWMTFLAFLWQSKNQDLFQIQMKQW